jgi:hypothetical protein
VKEKNLIGCYHQDQKLETSDNECECSAEKSLLNEKETA